MRFERRLVVALGYHVLAQVDLGPDAANLGARAERGVLRGRWPRPAWARRLEAALRASGPERGWVQFAPLQATSVAALAAARADRPAAAEWAEAIALATPAFARRHARDARRDAQVSAAHAALQAPLTALRDRLWAPASPPPLTVVDAPALRRSGRAVPGLVAVSLDRDPADLLCQIFHEDVHGVTDRQVRSLPSSCTQRDTRAGTPGNLLHRALEAAALDHGEVVVREATPELLPAYRAWRSAFG